jgi:hypothetical protein
MKMDKKIFASAGILSLAILAASNAWAQNAGAITISSAPSTIEPEFDGSTAGYSYHFADNANANINITELENFLATNDVRIDSGNNGLIINGDIAWAQPTKLEFGTETQPADFTFATGAAFTLDAQGNAKNGQQALILYGKNLASSAGEPTITIASQYSSAVIYQHPSKNINFLKFNANLPPKSASLPLVNAITVSTPAELQAINTNPNANYILVKDIDLKDYAWTPITQFNGILYGAASSADSHKNSILNLNVATTDNNGSPIVPVFIQHLTGGIENLYVKYTNAMLVGEAHPLSNTAPSPKIFDVGVTAGNITVKAGATANHQAIGGIIGQALKTNISDVAYRGILLVEQASAVGGVAGSLVNSTVSHSGASASITVYDGFDANSYVGGLVGTIAKNTQIYYSAAKGSIGSGSATVGGLVGASFTNAQTFNRIYNSYSMTNISTFANVSTPSHGPRYLGGFVGALIGATTYTEQTYSTGQLGIGSNGPSNPNLYVGGYAGFATQPHINSSYWDTDTSHCAKGIAAINSNTSWMPTGETDAQMKQPATYVNWNIIPYTGTDESPAYYKQWVMYTNQSQTPYPRLGNSPIRATGGDGWFNS